MGGLDGKRVFITGAGAGVGAGLAQACAAAGAHVIATSRGGNGRDSVSADRRDSVASDCERVSRG